MADFGLTSTPVSVIDHEALAHRLAYHPPECLQHDVISEISADVYALGVVAYALFAGYNPFQAPTIEGVKLAMLNLVPPELAIIVSGFPGDLSRDLERTLAKDPEDRPTSTELAMQLQSVLQRTDPETQITLPAYRMATIIE
jgi:serine/threonine protein kinase